MLERQNTTKLCQTSIPDSASLTILIVDDEPELADACARVLRASGFTCLTAYDGPQAFSLIDSQRLTLVLSDISLPTGSGFEIARFVRQKSPDMPVILMSGYRRIDLPQQASQVDAVVYLHKPFSNSELISAVKSLIPRA